MKRTPCPICGQAPVSAHAPFCSRGCRDRDLLQWLGEGYRIPAHPGDPTTADGLDNEPDRD